MDVRGDGNYCFLPSTHRYEIEFRVSSSKPGVLKQQANFLVITY